MATLDGLVAALWSATRLSPGTQPESANRHAARAKREGLREDMDSNRVGAAADPDGGTEDDDDALAGRREAGRHEIARAPIDEGIHGGHLARDDAPEEAHATAGLRVLREGDDGDAGPGEADGHGAHARFGEGH